MKITVTIDLDIDISDLDSLSDADWRVLNEIKHSIMEDEGQQEPITGIFISYADRKL